jgi:hypothetical protein
MNIIAPPPTPMVDEGRFVMQAYTSHVVGQYFQNNPSSLDKLRSILLKASDVAGSLIPDEGARDPIKAILRSQIEADFYPLSWVKNTIGPAIGRSWLLPAQNVESEIKYCLELPHVDDETKKRLRDCLDETILKSFYKVNQVADCFVDSKEEMKEEAMTGKNSNEILPRYLQNAINEHFSLAQDFAEAFNHKYQCDRVLMGDYIVNCEKLSDVHANLAMAGFNEELAPIVITGFSQTILNK